MGLRIFFCFFFGVLLLASSAFGKDFRKAKWADSKAVVKANNSGELIKEADHYLIYKGKVGKYPTFFTYIFKENKLVNGWVNFRKKYKNRRINCSHQ